MINKDLQEILDKQLALKIKTWEEGNYQPISGIIELLISINKHNATMAVASSSSILFIEAVLTKLKISISNSIVLVKRVLKATQSLIYF